MIRTKNLYVFEAKMVRKEMLSFLRHPGNDSVGYLMSKAAVNKISGRLRKNISKLQEASHSSCIFIYILAVSSDNPKIKVKRMSSFSGCWVSDGIANLAKEITACEITPNMLTGTYDSYMVTTTIWLGGIDDDEKVVIEKGIFRFIYSAKDYYLDPIAGYVPEIKEIRP